MRMYGRYIFNYNNIKTICKFTRQRQMESHLSNQNLVIKHLEIYQNNIKKYCVDSKMIAHIQTSNKSLIIFPKQEVIFTSKAISKKYEWLNHTNPFMAPADRLPYIILDNETNHSYLICMNKAWTISSMTASSLHMPYEYTIYTNDNLHLSCLTVFALLLLLSLLLIS